MSRKKKLAILLAVIASISFFSLYLITRKFRTVETSKIEKCLKIYKEYRKTQNQSRLSDELRKINLTPLDFQKIIDRLIYYRSRKSAMSQAMTLLKAFRLGCDIKVDKVVSISGLASEPFRLDAEILAVFESRPELIEEAFKG